MDLQGRVGGQRQLGRDTRDPLDLLDAVDHSIPSDILVRSDPGLLPFTEIQPPDQLTKDYNVHAMRDFRLERRRGDEGIGGEVCRSDISVQSECFSEGEKTLFGSDWTIDTPLWSTNRT